MVLLLSRNHGLIALACGWVSWSSAASSNLDISEPLDPETCEGGCTFDSDCQGDLVCYQRDAGDVLPLCCHGTEELLSGGANFCVSSKCASQSGYYDNYDPYNQYDDVFFVGLRRCELGCYGDGDCYHGLICWNTTANNAIPQCCAGEETSSMGSFANSTNICAPAICNDTTESGNTSDEAGDAGLGAVCFSGETLVATEQEIFVKMKDLRVGDRVLTGSGRYQEVYAFAHRNELQDTPFLQIHTANNAILEMSREHLVFVQHRLKPVRADALRVGDFLRGATSAKMITGIQHVRRQGLYAPLTKDGTLVVADGILASNYIAVQTTRDGYVQLTTVGMISLHQSDLAHLWMSPFRLFCGLSGYELSLCTTRTTTGMLQYADWGIQLVSFMEHQTLSAQLLVLIPSLIGLGFCCFIERVLIHGAPYWLLFCMCTKLSMSATRLLTTADHNKEEEDSRKSEIDG